MANSYLHPSLAERARAMADMSIPAAMVLGALLYGGLYCIGVFVAALWLGNPFLVAGAVATAGVTYLSFVAQIMDAPRAVAIVLVYGSIILGFMVGILLVMDIWH